MSDADEHPGRRRRRQVVVGSSALATAALVIVVTVGLGRHSAKTTSSPVQPFVPAAVSPLPSFYPPPIQSASDGHLGAMYATQILTYTPYVDDGPRPGLVITATESATDSAIDSPFNCSAVAHDLAPLRCISRSGPIYDPCFPNLEGSSCLFVASPAATKAVRVLLAPPTPAAPAAPPAPPQPSVSPNSWPGYSIANPWALDLTDGTECVFSHGAEDNVGGLRPNYECTDGRFVFGTPDETRSGWMVQLGASQSGPLTAQIGVTDAWLFANR